MNIFLIICNYPTLYFYQFSFFLYFDKKINRHCNNFSVTKFKSSSIFNKTERQMSFLDYRRVCFLNRLWIFKKHLNCKTQVFFILKIFISFYNFIKKKRLHFFIIYQIKNTKNCNSADRNEFFLYYRLFNIEFQLFLKNLKLTNLKNKVIFIN